MKKPLDCMELLAAVVALLSATALCSWNQVGTCLCVLQQIPQQCRQTTKNCFCNMLSW